jgi:hypothetical protein
VPLAALLLLASSAACGGKSLLNGTSPLGLDAGSCDAPIPPPQLNLFPNCDSFLPNLTGNEVDWVGLEPVAGSPGLIGHRFRATASLSNSCGFDLVIALPGLTFQASGSYELATWWLNGAPVAVIVRTPDDTQALLGVAVLDGGGGGYLSTLSAPISLQAFGRDCHACAGSDATGLKALAFSFNESPIQCAPTEGYSQLLSCDFGGEEMRVVDYCAPPGADAFPAVYGRADLLQ